MERGQKKITTGRKYNNNNNNNNRKQRQQKDLESSSRSSSCGSDSDWMEARTERRRYKKVQSLSRDFAGEAIGEPERKQKATSMSSSAEPHQQQCRWIRCVNPARPESKYCSDECGIQLAKSRILTLLQDKHKEWKMTPCVADEMSQKKNDAIQLQQGKLRELVNELEAKRVALDKFIEVVSAIDYQPGQNAEELVYEEGQVACVSCGVEVNIKTYLKHLERCYIKTESQVTFNSKHPTIVGGTPIFCDFLNHKIKTYCKRLKVLCPEHTKTPKHRSSAVCGAPLSSDPYELDTSNICRIRKSECNRHNCWEKLRRAEIDMQKVNAYMKSEALMDQERKCKMSMLERANVLGLLLHSTVIHNLQNKEAI